MSFPTLVGGVGTLRNNDTNTILGINAGDEFTYADWLEAVSLYSPSQLSIGGKRSRATLTAYVPWDRVRIAIFWLLGYSWVDSSGYLRRNVPACHPLFLNLFANEIVECVGVEFNVKAIAPHWWSLPYAKYNLAKITVAFSQPQFDILSDDEIVMTNIEAYRGQELRRWCSWVPKPYVDILDLPGGIEKFDAPGKSWNNIPTSRQIIRAQKSTMKLVWHEVPLDFLCTPFGEMRKIASAIGKINSDDFFGTNNSHTWLLDDVDVVGQNVYSDPIATNAVALVGANENYTGQYAALARRLDLMFTFRYFNPTNAKVGSTERGWRLRPAVDGQWYPTTANVANGVIFPEETSFQKLFTHWSDI